MHESVPVLCTFPPSTGASATKKENELNESKVPEKRPKKLTFCPTKKNKSKNAFSFRPRWIYF